MARHVPCSVNGAWTRFDPSWIEVSRVQEVTEMDRRAVFDKVKAHLLQQGKKSHKKLLIYGEETVTCAYRGEGGLKCAVGCLILDEHYHPQMENGTPTGYNDVGELVRRSICASLGTPLVNEKHVDMQFLRRLQLIHDENPVDRWPMMLDQVEKDITK